MDRDSQSVRWLSQPKLTSALAEHREKKYYDNVVGQKEWKQVRQKMTLAERYPAYPARRHQSAGHQLREKQRATKQAIFEVEYLTVEDMVFTELYC